MSNVYQRFLKKNGDPTYYGRFTFQGKRYLRNLGTSDKAKALGALRRIIGVLNEGRVEVLDAFRLRAPACGVRLGVIFALYRRATEGSLQKTREQNIRVISLLVRRVRGDGVDVDQLPVSELSSDFVWKYKQTALEAAEDGDDLEEQRICRSANSLLRQARSLFTPALQHFYRREGGIELPHSIEGFRSEPKFKNVGKEDYFPPDDTIIAKTLADLERFVATDRNLYLAVWLALGFGLRKSEIAAARPGWFIERDGAVYCRGDVLAKNGANPDVRVQLGAWEKLGPLLQGRPAGEYLLAGSATERCETVYRRVSAWLSGMGWTTRKRIHEFRAFAGCKVAEVHGLLAAKEWLRHGSYVTTERHYGRYIKMRISEVKLNLPTVVPAQPFQPKVLPSGA
jgi:integrase